MQVSPQAEESLTTEVRDNRDRRQSGEYKLTWTGSAYSVAKYVFPSDIKLGSTGVCLSVTIVDFQCGRNALQRTGTH
jgi:hypothetical protein